MVQAAPSSATATATATATPVPVPDADHTSPPSRLLSKHRPRRRAAPPRPVLPPPAPTRGLPDLNRCHCCFVRFQPPAPGAKRRPLRPLRSLWRIVVLCSECISLLRSGAVCSYCLSLHNLPHEDSITCRSCNRCVHHYCIPAEHRTALIQPVDLENFVCVDCCPTVKVGSKNAGANSVPKLELVIREPSSAVRRKGEPVAVAKLNSPRKVVEEVIPASNDAMALVPVGEGSESKGPGDPDLPDEALALQLHLAINGSPRISRSGSASLVVSAGQGKRQNGLVYGRKVNEDLGLCVTNMMDHLDYLEIGAEMGSNWNANQVLGSDPSAPVVLALECKGKRPQESTRGKRKGPPGTKQHNSLVDWYKVDRYEKKYSKRKSSKQTDVESTGNKTSPNGKDMDVGEGGDW